MTDLETICQQIDVLIDLLGGYWSEEWLIYPVMEELGEFAKELQIAEGLHPKKTTSHKKMEEEFGDLLFAVLALGRGLNFDIEQAITQSIKKFQSRDVK